MIDLQRPAHHRQLTYAYDANGRRIQMGGSLAQSKLPNAMTALYDEANRLIQFNARSFSYDNNGNLTNDGLRGYGWDVANRLTGITGAASASFQYDAIGRRISKTINGTQTGFLYDGANPVQELTGSTPKANLLTGGMDEYFTRTDSSGTRNFLTDALGSTIALSDAAGSLMTQYSYEPYGNTTASGEANANAFQYTGRENDGTGLYFYRARYYDPELSRFISQDPIGFNGGINIFAYVGGNPISFVDPDGLRVRPPSRSYGSGNARQRRYDRRHPPERPKTPESGENAQESAGYYDDEGEYVCLRWYCPSPRTNQCGPNSATPPQLPSSPYRSATNWIPSATDPKNPPAGCYCDAPNWRPNNAPNIDPYGFIPMLRPSPKSVKPR